jgi:hypothetical protein
MPIVPNALEMCWEVIVMALRVPMLLPVFCESVLFCAIRSQKTNLVEKAPAVEYIDDKSWNDVILSLLSRRNGHAVVDKLGIWSDALACVAEK